MTLPSQSPIDIDAPLTRQSPSLDLHYRRSPVERVHMGSTLQVDCEPGSHMVLDGQRWTLEQLHFHTPAEHRLKSRALPLEIHFVHSGGAAGKAVLAVFVDVGGRNEALEVLLDGVPQREGERGLPVDFDPAAFVPRYRDHYRYDGSLTTPPYEEGVRWCVFGEPISAADTQLRRYAAAFGPNARELQARNDRTVFECRY